jgi:transposase
MKSKAYAASAVNRVDAEKVTKERQGQALVVGMDVGKFEILAAARWSDGSFERPWRISNPEEITLLTGLLGRLGQQCVLTVAMEPSGTYGDPLRQALSDAQLVVQRVSPKAAHDYAEIFDGVPSQHDGKDAAVVAELAALGKCAPWTYRVKDIWEQELAYWVDWMDAQRQQLLIWTGRVEGLLSRHWPEATRLLKPSSATLLHALVDYGGPAGLAADRQAGACLKRWGGCFLSQDKVDRLLAVAASSVGVRQGEVERRRLQTYAAAALAARREVRRSQRRLRKLAVQQPVIEAMGGVVGMPTACVLWACLGDPRQYPCGEAYRKAMGLNLAERSSGIFKGKLKISKRGNPQARRWLYMAALRLIKHSGVQRWYRQKLRRDGQTAKKALVGVMRKLVLALYQVGVNGAEFDSRRLFPGEATAKKVAAKTRTRGEAAAKRAKAKTHTRR